MNIFDFIFLKNLNDRANKADTAVKGSSAISTVILGAGLAYFIMKAVKT
ncbi:MAG: hypothetical protein AAB276_06255 [Pseudomonadota bacterium]